MAGVAVSVTIQAVKRGKEAGTGYRVRLVWLQETGEGDVRKSAGVRT